MGDHPQPNRRLSTGTKLPYVENVTPANRPSAGAGLVLIPPYLAAPDLGVVAIDVAFGSIPADNGLALLCMGGHPARECILEARSPGPSHEAIVAIDLSRPHSFDFVKRLRRYLHPDVSLRVVESAQRERETGEEHATA